MKVINDLNGLRDSKFGQPDPRHGLELLYWFSREYIDIDANKRMKPKQDHPKTRAFGFSLFHNNEQILPKRNLPYYEVGNLHSEGADELPQYVSKKDTHRYDGSNKDRIIIALKESDIIEKVYLTEHKDPKNFKPSQTYQVSQSVIEQIRTMELEQFLKLINPEPNTSWWWCTIL